MDWLKKNYEKVLITLVALLVIGVAAMIFQNSRNFIAVFEQRNHPAPPDNTVDPAPIESVTTALESLEEPAVWVPGEGSLFVSRTYILKDGMLIDPLESEIPLHPPIPNKWIMKYNLDPSDSNLKHSDPDGDSFTTLEEWMAQTDPTDPESIPPYFIKLRLKDYVEVPFRLKFTTPDGGETFAINTVDRRGRTQFLKLGDTIHGSPYKLVRYEPQRKRDKHGVDRDVSILELENTENGETVTLINDQVVNSPSSFAIFSYLYDGSEIRVKRTETFSLPPDEESRYKLIDISKTEAVIQDAQSGVKVRILPSEIEILNGQDSEATPQP